MLKEVQVSTFGRRLCVSSMQSVRAAQTHRNPLHEALLYTNDKEDSS